MSPACSIWSALLITEESGFTTLETNICTKSYKTLYSHNIKSNINVLLNSSPWQTRSSINNNNPTTAFMSALCSASVDPVKLFYFTRQETCISFTEQPEMCPVSDQPQRRMCENFKQTWALLHSYFYRQWEKKEVISVLLPLLASDMMASVCDGGVGEREAFLLLTERGFETDRWHF